MNLIEEFGLDRNEFEWKDLGMCHNLPTDLFYDHSDDNPEIAKNAKAICDYCPVKDMCLGKGQEDKEFGIWGGKKLQNGKIIE